MTKIPLGKIGFTDAGTVDKDHPFDEKHPFRRFDFITDEDSCYLSLVDNNVGTYLDPLRWRCIANGKSATEAALKTLAAINDAVDATAKALAATNSANAAGSSATTNAALANTAAKEAEAAVDITLQTKAEAEDVINRGEIQINSMKAAEQALMNQALLAPSSMELNYVKKISLGNTVAQKISVNLFPSYVLHNVLFQQAFYSGDALYVDKDGNLTVNKTGTATINVIPTNNTSLAQTIVIEVVEPVMRLNKGNIRLLSGGRIRKY